MTKKGYCQLSDKWCPSLDEHHIYPQHAGGENSKTILLDPGIHHLLHRCAKNPSLTEEFLAQIPKYKHDLAKEMITVLRNAEHVKVKHKVTINLDANTFNRLKDIAKTKQTSMENIIKSCIEYCLRSFD